MGFLILTSVEAILKKKFIYPGDPDYGYLPLMALWKQKCPFCDCYAVSSSRIGVQARLKAHIRRDHPGGTTDK